MTRLSAIFLCVACAGPAPRASSEPAPTATETAQPEPIADAPPALPARITAEVEMPGPDANRYASATVSLEGLPWTVDGCVSSVRGACWATSHIELDDAARAELVRAIEEVRAIPLCEPEGIFPGDRTYRLEVTGGPRVYEGHLPSDESAMSARNDGPCRADARLAWWIAQRLGPSAPRPHHVALRLTTTRPGARRFLSVELNVADVSMSGCSSAVLGSCRRATNVSLDDADEELARMLNAVAANAACPQPSADGVLTLELGVAYNGRCSEMATLGWWIAEHFDPSAMHSE